MKLKYHTQQRIEKQSQSVKATFAVILSKLRTECTNSLVQTNLPGFVLINNDCLSNNLALTYIKAKQS